MLSFENRWQVSEFLQNSTIFTNSERWPFMMDPQLQGIQWIKERELKSLLEGSIL